METQSSCASYYDACTCFIFLRAAYRTKWSLLRKQRKGDLSNPPSMKIRQSPLRPDMTPRWTILGYCGIFLLPAGSKRFLQVSFAYCRRVLQEGPVGMVPAGRQRVPAGRQQVPAGREQVTAGREQVTAGGSCGRVTAGGSCGRVTAGGSCRKGTDNCRKGTGNCRKGTGSCRRVLQEGNCRRVLQEGNRCLQVGAAG